MQSKKVIALEGRLKQCRNVITLGVRPNFADYSPEEAAMIDAAEKIYYPSLFYADLFDITGKKTFPSYHTYKCVQDKIKQTALFSLLKIPHPRTHVFYGSRQKASILKYFSFPLIGKIPRGSAMGRGIFLIRSEEELSTYLDITDVAYIQEYLPIERDIRVLVIGKKAVHAYWRIPQPGEFRTNLDAGGSISLDPIPKKAIELALHTARACQWDDVGIDVCFFNNQYYVFEANMKYGKQGFAAAGIDYGKFMENLIENGDI